MSERNRGAQLSVFIREKAASFERNHQPWRRDYFSTGCSPTIYIYICTELRLWRIENGRGQKKKKGEPSQSQDNLPLKTFAKPRQRDRETLFVEMPVVPPRRLFVVEKSATGIHVVSSFVSAFLNAPHQKDESQRMRGGLLFPPSPFPLCPNSTLPSPSSLLMVSSRRRKTDEGGGEDYVRSIISRVMQYRG